MATIWTATVPLPASVPLDQVHVMLYSYFPATTPGESRPYVWRLLSRDRIGVVSAARPTTPAAAAFDLSAGITFDFVLTFKRVRNVGGGTSVRRSGEMRHRQYKPIRIDNMVELRERLVRFAGERGGSIGYARLDRMRDVVVHAGVRRISLPVVDAVGQVLVTDPDRFAALLASGGPGTGKAYGCGCWWLPSLFESGRAAA